MSEYEFKIHHGTQKKIAVALRDPGAVRFMMPAIQQLTNEGCSLLIVLSGWAREHQDEFVGFTQYDSPNTFQPDVLIRTAADLRDSGMHALPQEYDELWSQVCTIDIDDAPGSSDRIVMHQRRSPDAVLVFNELAKTDLLQNRQDVSSDAVFVTGNPDFDVFEKHDASALRLRARAVLGIADDEFLIFFPGQLEPLASYILEHTLRALMLCTTQKKIVFLHTNHPRATTDERRLYSKLLADTTCRYIDWQEASGDLGYGADLLLHTHSTEGLKSVFRGVPVVVLGFPEEFTYDYMEAYPAGKPPFQVRAGAAFWTPEVSDHSAVASLLTHAIEDTEAYETMRLSAKNAFNADGMSTRRVVAAIKHVFAERKSGGTGSQTG